MWFLLFQLKASYLDTFRKICEQCKGLVARNRKAAHDELWCPSVSNGIFCKLSFYVEYSTRTFTTDFIDLDQSMHPYRYLNYHFASRTFKQWPSDLLVDSMLVMELLTSLGYETLIVWVYD